MFLISKGYLGRCTRGLRDALKKQEGEGKENSLEGFKDFNLCILSILGDI